MIKDRLLIFTSLFTILLNFSYAQKQVKFTVEDVPGDSFDLVGIRGSEAPLSWDITKPLDKNGEAYTTVMEFSDKIKSVEFKFVLMSATGEVRWEGTPNRMLKLESSSGTVESLHRWEVEQVIDISTLPLLTLKELANDYKLIEEVLLKVHPGTYRYNSETEVSDGLKELEITFSKTISHGEAYLAISKLLAQLKCDHTFASFYNQNQIIKSVIHWQKDKLPFAFKWIDERMIVTYSAIDEVKRGQEIRTINGQEVSGIGRSLLPYVSADGSTDKSRWAKLNVDGYDFRWSAFDVFHPLVFPILSETFEIKVFDFNSNRENNLTLSWMTLDERTQILKSKYPSFPASRDDLLRFEIKDDVGIMRLGSFGIFGWKKLEKDYNEFFSEVFAQLKKEKIAHLIIDMRENNGGGDAMAEELLTYLDVDRIVINDRVGKTRYKEFPESLKPYCKTWGDNPWYYSLKPESREGLYFVFSENMQVDMKNKKKKNYFKGKTYWLTSPENASLAYYTPKAVRQYGLGPLIGEETGGNLQGINGGQILFLQLPNSQIEIDFPVMGDFSINSQPDRGVEPDYEVKAQPSDIAWEKDRTLEYALGMTKE